jgi:hypothetical protein
MREEMWYPSKNKSRTSDSRESEVARVFTAAHRDCHIRKIFFYFGPFINNILHLNLIKFYFQIWQFSIARSALAWFLIVTPNPWRDSLHVDIRCHINPVGPVIFFGTQNEPHYFDWRGFSMSRATPLDMTHFRSKSAKSIFLSFNIFPK